MCFWKCAGKISTKKGDRVLLIFDWRSFLILDSLAGVISTASSLIPCLDVSVVIADPPAASIFLAT